MQVTIFKKLKDVNAPFYRDVFHILERIKIGTSKELIEKVRSAKKKDVANEFKNQLPAICFCGTFKNRADASIITQSGLAILDFDHFETNELLNENLENLRNDKYTFCCFVSPSGDGIKALVKVPLDINAYRLHYKALGSYYNSKYFDPKNINISRVCFESYDPDIYINKDSEVFTDKAEETEELNYNNSQPTIKLENENEIIQRLYKWFCKAHSMTVGSRNQNLFILASAFSDYGINKTEAIRFCHSFEQKDFTKTEIERTIKSAYSKGSSNFGMKYFEDSVKLSQVKQEIKQGVPLKDIKEANPTIDEEVLKNIKQDATANDFWVYTKKGVKIENYQYKLWLEGNGFYKYYPEGSESFIFIKVTGNIIDNTTEFKIKDFVLNELLEKKEYKVYEFLSGNPKYFKDDYLNILSESNIFFKDDTIDTGYIYFRNMAVEVTKDKFNLIDYINLDGFVWRKHIIDYDFEPCNNTDCDFSKFIELICSKDDERINAITSTIGYLMHSFKTSANNKAVILNDEIISENPNGGSGKGIFWNALSKVKRVSDVNGKSFSFDKSFPYQTVSADTQILVFDDVQKNFKFENLFSVITEGITLEKKNKDAIKIPVSKSPKIIITTNYTIGGVGGSFERRKWELEFSSYFSSSHTPLNEFGRMLFDEWDKKEWIKFYNYMILCLQMYLVNGLVDHKFKNLDTRKLIKETCYEFFEWVQESDLIVYNKKIYRSALFNQFIEEYPDYKKFLTNKKFYRWIEIYFKFRKLEFETGRSMDGKWILIKFAN